MVSNESNKSWVEIVIACSGILVGILAMYSSFELVSLNRSVEDKIKKEVSQQLYDSYYINASEVLLSYQYMKTNISFDTEIWSLNALLEYFYSNDPYVGSSLISRLTLSYEKGKTLQNDLITEFLFYKMDTFLEADEKNNNSKNQKNIEGILWTLYHVKLLARNFTVDINKEIASRRKKYKSFDEFISRNGKLADIY